MINKMVDIGTPDYGISINVNSTISIILSVRRFDVSDDGNKPILMLSNLRVDGVSIDSPLTRSEVIERLKQAQAQSVPGVYED